MRSMIGQRAYDDELSAERVGDDREWLMDD
jgi:hypothetical protein